MKNTVRAVLAGMILSLSLASCTPKSETTANETSDTLKVDTTQVVAADTTQVAGDTSVSK